ncbi:interleukin-10 receptor subunit beta-like isoform X2 [Pristis pectinata]|uniref:interleukin-10 receptor subunit beta-like isoform X2 n=1 Tax=Pristis pectinata TaxID=685728 RepID=UPI00223CB818|nr:interleukin-10 receptor subunit beta-like isoform X2 [Pristis pectinata]
MAVGRILLHSLLTAALTLAVFGKLPSPQDVKMHSINFKSILQWSPVTYHKGNVHYSVEYQSYYNNQYKQEPLEKGCTNISITECDLSNELATMIGYYLRVRAEYKDETSEWTNVTDFEPYDDTEIGPPIAVIVKPRLDMLDIHISEPVNENDNKSMHEYFTDLGYKVFYWEDAEEKKIENTYIQQKMITLTNLKPWTTYCLKVKPVLGNRITHSSSVTCETTKDNGRFAVWKIVYLKEPSLHSPFLPPQTQNLPEECFDKLNFISDVQECFDNTDVDGTTKLDMLEVYTLKKENEDKEKQAQNNNTNLYARVQTLPKSAL